MREHHPTKSPSGDPVDARPDGNVPRWTGSPDAGCIIDASRPDASLPPESAALLENLEGTEIQDLLVAFTRAVGVPGALIDREGNVLFASTWQRICTDFHRVDPLTCTRCIESDTVMASALDAGKDYARYLCGNGLMACASPVVIDGRHVANVLVGQFLAAPPDEAFFRNQAKEFHFDEDAYMGALREVTVVDEPRLRTILALLTHFLAATARLGATLGLDRRRAMDAENRLRLILDAIPQVVFWKDRDGVYVGGNRPMLEAMRLERPEELAGKTEIDLGLAPEVAKSCAVSDRTVIDSGERMIHIEARVQNPGGTHTWSDTSKIPLVDESGEVCGLLGISEDITERKESEQEILRLNAELETRVGERTRELAQVNRHVAAINEQLTATNNRLRERNRQLDEATRAKSDFLAAMSHDLRTPMNSILGFSGILLQDLAGPLTGEQRTQIEMINASGRHLLELINHVLDLSKIEAGKVRLDRVDCDVRQIARSVADIVTPLARQKNLELRVDIDPRCSTVRADRTRVEQILLNLLGNAVKFSDSGRVSLEVRPEDEEICFSVADSGCGISARDLERVFDDFYQVARPEGGPVEGTGLGLPVARRLAELLNGRIDVESAPERGSTFTLRLPASAPDGGAADVSATAVAD